MTPLRKELEERLPTVMHCYKEAGKMSVVCLPEHYKIETFTD